MSAIPSAEEIDAKRLQGIVDACKLVQIVAEDAAELYDPQNPKRPPRTHPMTETFDGEHLAYDHIRILLRKALGRP